MNEISLNHTFEYYLRNSAAKHPSMQAQDIVKLCFQAAFGAEHLLRGTDEAAAGIRLMEEFKQVPAGAGENLFEPDLQQLLPDKSRSMEGAPSAARMAASAVCSDRRTASRQCRPFY